MNPDVMGPMHLHVIDDEDRITKYQDMLADRLRKAGELRRGMWGHQGGNGGDKMHWFPDDGFWWGYERLVEDPNPRHWNAFGLTEPTGGLTSHSIACEINIPLSNGTWRVAGAFVEDDSGEIYVVHSGKIGGGRKRVGRSTFVANFAYTKQWVHAERNGKHKDVVVVSALDDASLIQNLAHFTREVYRIKEIAHLKQTPPPPPGAYGREFGGYRKPYSVKTEIRAKVEHGKIVHNMRYLATGMGLDVWNNRQTDLLLRRKNTAMVEVKTDDTRYSRYTAIGQLLYNSESDDNVLIAVFPSIDAPFRKVLRNLGIVGATWRRDRNTYKFSPELHMTLERL